VYSRWQQIAFSVTSGVFRVGADKLPGDGVFINKPYSTSAPVRVLRELIRQKQTAAARHS
jgi:hypothetical protein